MPHAFVSVCLYLPGNWCGTVCPYAAFQGFSLVKWPHRNLCRYLLHQGIDSNLNQNLIFISRLMMDRNVQKAGIWPSVSGSLLLLCMRMSFKVNALLLNLDFFSFSLVPLSNSAISGRPFSFQSQVDFKWPLQMLVQFQSSRENIRSKWPSSHPVYWRADNCQKLNCQM